MFSALIMVNIVFELLVDQSLRDWLAQQFLVGNLVLATQLEARAVNDRKSGQSNDSSLAHF